MANATNGRERSEQKVWLKRAAEGRLGPYKDMPAQLQKDLRANKTLWTQAVKNGVVSGAKKTTTKK